MPQVKKHKKKTKKTKTAVKTKIILVPANDISSEEDREEEFDEGGVFLDKESVQLIYNCSSRFF
jgi:hypothetical protein